MAKDIKEDKTNTKKSTVKPKAQKSKAAAGAKTATKTKKTVATKGPRPGDEVQAAEGAPPKSPKAKGPARPRRPLMPQTYFAKNGESPDMWRLIDASGQPLGRLSTHIANILMGKNKPNYTRHSDTGDHVIVINAKDVVLTGKKMQDKEYNYHTGYAGGIKTFKADDVRQKTPERLIEWAVFGMLPKGHMGRRWYKKLRVFAGTEHPHGAQMPQVVTLPNLLTRKRA